MTAQPVQIGRAVLYHGLCEEILPSITADVLVSDPPYRMPTKGAGRLRRSRQYMDRIERDHLNKGFDVSILDPSRFGSIMVFVHTSQLPEILSIAESNYDRFALLVWHKTNAMPLANRNYRPDTEYVIHAWKKHRYPLGSLSDLSRYIMAPIEKHDFDHGTVKPVNVMRKFVRNANGETVCDPYCGTGSTGVAALLEGRSFIGIEKDRRWFDIACQRLEAAQHDLKG